MENKNRWNGKIIQGFEILSAFDIGYKTIVLAKNKYASLKEKYLCGILTNNGVYEIITDCLISDNYAELASVMGERIMNESEKVLRKLEEIQIVTGDNLEITECDRFENEAIEKKVLVLDGDKLPPEYRCAAYQLMYCTGGFGAQRNPRGRTCFVKRIYDDQEMSWIRSDFIGYMPEEKLPKWAKEKIQNIKENK